MMAVQGAETPVQTPVEPTVTHELLLLHVPPAHEVVSVTVAPTQTLCGLTVGPVIGQTGFTVTGTFTEQPFLEYVM